MTLFDLAFTQAMPSSNMLVERLLVSPSAVKVILSFSGAIVAQQLHGPMVCTRDQLFAMKPAGMASRSTDIPEGIRKRTQKVQGRKKSAESKSKAKKTRLREDISRVSRLSLWPNI